MHYQYFLIIFTNTNITNILLIQGRMYDGHVLDMVELGVESYEGIDAFPGRTKGLGSKPLFTFLGDQWETDSTYIRVQNVLIGTFSFL